jgi:N-acetylglucosaminyldiphosphoundecaprenol N-acetyl-beta-D-mannosaminyltransferase
VTGPDGGEPALVSKPAPPIIRLLGLPFFSVTEAQLVRHVLDASDGGRGGWIITPNLDILRQGTDQPDIRALLLRADVLVADGMPLIWASRLQRTPLPERVAGSHIMWSIPREAAARGKSLFLLGGSPGAADACAAVLSGRFPGLRITGTCCPPFGFENSDAEIAKIGAAVAASPADIVFVALSFPKGERLIERIREVAPHAWWIGVGISFSFVAGDVKKAPRWLQLMGLEWLHRLVQEPRRLARRYLVDGLPFAARLLVGAAWRGIRGH